jgi:hypothetical protein
MRSRDFFGVAVRVIGLWEIVEGAYSGFWGVLKVNTGVGVSTASEHYAFAIYFVVLGLLMIVLADPIVRMVYGSPSKIMPHDDAADRSSAGD